MPSNLPAAPVTQTPSDVTDAVTNAMKMEKLVAVHDVLPAPVANKDGSKRYPLGIP